jgi:hypothetical protein
MEQYYGGHVEEFEMALENDLEIIFKFLFASKNSHFYYENFHIVLVTYA